MFTSDFFENVIVCFTRFSMCQKSQALRRKKKELDKNDLILQMQKEFKDRFKFDMKYEQFAFIDNTVPHMDEYEIEPAE